MTREKGFMVIRVGNEEKKERAEKCRAVGESQRATAETFRRLIFSPCLFSCILSRDKIERPVCS